MLGPRAGVPSADVVAAIDELPVAYKDFELMSNSSESVLGSHPHVNGYIRFVLHHFYYRHINAIEYLVTYSKSSPRKIDMLVPSLVDFMMPLLWGRESAGRQRYGAKARLR